MAKLELRKAKRQDDGGIAPKALATIPDEGFIPFVCHYDPNTILTKNGELLQVIRITGFAHQTLSAQLVNLRKTIRDAITKHIKSNNFALWLHTIRRRKDISPKGDYAEFFPNLLNELWEEEGNWKNQFVNELYLTVIVEGYDTSIINFNSLLRSLSFSGTKNLHQRELQKSHQLLSNTVSKVLGELNAYGAKLLGIAEWQGVLYSEPMRFFGKIVNLDEDRYPISVNDMSSDLASRKIAFGSRSLEVTGKGKRNFAAMFSIKEYSEIGVAVLDQFLQLPQEFIISQSIDFINRDRALEYFDYQHYILDVSGDDQFKYLSGLDSVISSDSGSATDYGEQQITVMLINSSPKGLQKDIDNSLERLFELGLVTVREDIFSAHCFWSQLPGNFIFLRRQKPINTARVGGFASLHNFPAGNRGGNYWGEAVSIFRTILGTPYFFNFHDGNNGHTLIAGPLGSGKTVLLNFLVCQSRKFANKLYYFGYNRSGNIFINAIGGNYLSVTKNKNDKQGLKLNPLLLADTEANRKFLYNWFRYLVSYGSSLVDEKELALIPEIVDKIVTSGIKKLSGALEFFNAPETKNVYNKLLQWSGNGKFAFVFDHDEENDWAGLVNAFNLTPVLSYQHIVIPIVSYILHKIENSLDGNKTMIVLDEAWKLIDNYATGPDINNWLKKMREKNCMVIFATEGLGGVAQSNITKNICEQLATRIFLPDYEPTDYYKTIFGLNDEEFNLLSAMSRQEHHFLLKHGEDSVIAALDLSGIRELIHILSAKPKTLIAMEEIIKEFGTNPKDWLGKFFEIIVAGEENIDAAEAAK